MKLFTHIIIVIIFLINNPLKGKNIIPSDTLKKEVKSQINEIIPTDLELISPIGNISARSPIEFKWSNVNQSYKFEVSDNRDFSNIIHFSIISSTNFGDVVSKSLDIPFERFKTYYWRVSLNNGASVSSSFIISLPGKTTLLAPLDQKVIEIDTVRLIWEAQENVVDYQVQVTRNNFNSFFIVTMTSNTYLTLRNLSYDQNYSWKVRARTRLGWGEFSDVRSFKTRIGDVSSVSLINPRNNAVNEFINPVLRWTNNENASSYQLQVSKDSFNTLELDIDTSVTSVELKDLSHETKYYWRVRAKNDYSTSEWSEVYNFTTIRALVTGVELRSPANESIIDIIRPTLIWNIDENADTYRVQVSNNSFETSFMDIILETTTLRTVELEYNTDYQWRVKAINSVSESDWSQPWSFTTRLGDVTGIELITPQQDSINAPINSTLRWTADANASSYQLQMSVDGFNSTVVDQELSDTTFIAADLSYATAYHWRVRAKNEYSTSDWSAVRSFTTRPADAAIVGLNSPADGASLDNTSPTLVWNADPNADFYRLQLSKNAFNTLLVDSILTDTSFIASNLAFNANHQWRVKAINSVSESEWSQPWFFITRVGDVTVVNLLSPSNNEVLDFIAPTFTWKHDVNADSYQLQVSEDAFTSLLIDETLSDTTYQSFNLQNGKAYQWRVKSVNEYSSSDWSTFRFEIPVTTSMSNELPLQTSLEQNYPNPFNPTTQINYTLKEFSEVILEVYNMNGERISQLVNQSQSAGQYSVTFNATNLPSGMYVYRLSANGNIISRKMMLIK